MKTVGLRDLFNALPASILRECDVADERISDQQLARVMARTNVKCGLKSTPKHRPLRPVRLIPAVAILLAVAVVTGLALSSYSVTPSYPVPTITHETLVPMVEYYDGAVPVGASVEQDGLRVTVDRYAVDTVDKRLRLLITVESTDGRPLTEPATAERMSQIARTKFRRMELTCYGDADQPLVIDREHMTFLHGDGGFLWRTDNAADLYKTTFQLSYRLLGGSGEEFLNKHFVLTLTDYRDEVRTMEDIGFSYETLQALYEDMTPADTEDLKAMQADDGDAELRCMLSDSGQQVRFCTELKAHIDNIGFFDSEDDADEHLYIAYDGLADAEDIPAFIDARNGAVAIGECAAWEGDRVTVCYRVTREDLPHLFMMNHVTYETVTRAEGTWVVPFTVKDAAVPVYTYEVDAHVAYHEYALELNRLWLTDSSLWFEADFTITPPPEGEQTYGDVYGTIDVVLADGTVLKNPFYQGPGSTIWQVSGSGTCRWGGELKGFIDAEQVVAVIALGERIELK